MIWMRKTRWYPMAVVWEYFGGSIGAMRFHCSEFWRRFVVIVAGGNQAAIIHYTTKQILWFTKNVPNKSPLGRIGLPQFVRTVQKHPNIDFKQHTDFSILGELVLF